MAEEEQHFICAGPGQRPEEDVPAQSDCQRQLPPLPQEVLVQHLMSPASAGQAPEMETPPLEEQVAELMQTPRGRQGEKVSREKY